LDLSSISFIDEELGKLPEENTSFYVKSVKGEKTVNFDKSDSWVIHLGNSSDLSGLYIKVNSGKVDVNTYYYLEPSSLKNLTLDKRLTLTRSYKKVKGEGDKILPGDIIEIKLDFDFNSDSPQGGYKIVDILPSGLSLLENPSLYGLSTDSWITQTENNVLTHYSYLSPWWYKYKDTPIVYYARVTSNGKYIWEPAIIQSQLDLSVFQATQEDKLTIGN
jgi:signal peptidase I